jgi:hypothetical protein
VATGEDSGPISLTITGEHGVLDRVVNETFQAFRTAIATFIEGVRLRKAMTPYTELRRIVEVIATGADISPSVESNSV